MNRDSEGGGGENLTVHVCTYLIIWSLLGLRERIWDLTNDFPLSLCIHTYILYHVCTCVCVCLCVQIRFFPVRIPLEKQWCLQHHHQGSTQKLTTGYIRVVYSHCSSANPYSAGIVLVLLDWIELWLEEGGDFGCYGCLLLGSSVAIVLEVGLTAVTRSQLQGASSNLDPWSVLCVFVNPCLSVSLLSSISVCLSVCPRYSGAEERIVSTPPFAESVTEGDLKWEKGEAMIHTGNQAGDDVSCSMYRHYLLHLHTHGSRQEGAGISWPRKETKERLIRYAWIETTCTATVGKSCWLIN